MNHLSTIATLRAEIAKLDANIHRAAEMATNATGEDSIQQRRTIGIHVSLWADERDKAQLKLAVAEREFIDSELAKGDAGFSAYWEPIHVKFKKLTDRTLSGRIGISVEALRNIAASAFLAGTQHKYPPMIVEEVDIAAANRHSETLSL